MGESINLSVIEITMRFIPNQMTPRMPPHLDISKRNNFHPLAREVQKKLQSHLGKKSPQEEESVSLKAISRIHPAEEEGDGRIWTEKSPGGPKRKLNKELFFFLIS